MSASFGRCIPNPTPCRRSRREFLWQVGGGFAGLALIDLLARDDFFAVEARGAAGAERGPTKGEPSGRGYVLHARHECHSGNERPM